MVESSLISRASVLEVLQELIRTPSVNPSLAPEAGPGEAAIAVVARDWLAAHGMRCWIEEAAPGRPNVVAETGEAAGPALVLCAHLDTVGTAGMTIPPFEPKVAGRRVYGRGSYDMKGSATAGIPTVNYGPAGAGAHEAVEWVDLDSVFSCAQVLAETARRFYSKL